MRRSAWAPWKQSRPRDDVAAVGFDATIVSEALWTNWCDTVHRFGLGPEKLGRLAPSLQALPTVIWHTRLEDYSDRSLGPNSPAQDARRKARQRGAGNLLHGARSAGHRHAAKKTSTS